MQLTRTGVELYGTLGYQTLNSRKRAKNGQNEIMREKNEKFQSSLELFSRRRKTNPAYSHATQVIFRQAPPSA